MALFPEIDSPCPLNVAEQRAIKDDCARCGKHVHALNGLSDARRVDLLAAADGPICVSYKISAAQARRMSGVGFAMAVTLVAASAAAEAPVQSSDESGSEKLEMVIFVGGVNDPADAAWIDDSDLPELPVVIESPVKTLPPIKKTQR